MDRLSTSRRRVFVAGLASALAAASAIGVYAVATAGSSSGATRAEPPFAYSAKFACAPEVGATAFAFEPGRYRTTVNVHNPSTTATATLQKKAVVANREGQPFSNPGQIRTLELTPDAAFSIDCKDIKSLLPAGGVPVGDGFVVVYSSLPIDVVAVYTVNREVTTSSGQGVGEGIDVERVPCSPGVGSCPLQ